MDINLNGRIVEIIILQRTLELFDIPGHLY